MKHSIRRPFAFFLIGMMVLLNQPASLLAAPGNTVAPVASSASAQNNSAAVAGLPVASDLQPQEVVVIQATGVVERQAAGTSAWKPLVDGGKLSPHDKIRTGADGRLRLQFESKIELLILGDSELTVEQARRKGEAWHTLLDLGAGKLKVQADKLSADSTFEVRTPTAVAAVRGTTFYLNVVRFAQGLSGILTNLYVDEGLVDFSALEDALKHLSVATLHSASIGGDGTTTGPRQLSPEEREELIREFEEALEKLKGNPQTAIEFGALPPGPLADVLPGDGVQRDAVENLIDSLVKLREEDLNLGTGGDVPTDQTGSDEEPVEDTELLDYLKEYARLLSDGVDGSGNFELESVSPDTDFGFGPASDLGIVAEDRLEPRDAALAANTSTEVLLRIDDLQAIRNAEKDELRQDLVSILGDQIVRQTDAEMEQQFDAQTGKVFTDIHGNRVRTDQYIYHEPGSDTVDMVSLTLRTGEYQNGITSFHFSTQFNQALPDGTVLRELPWSDFLNVVTWQDFQNRGGQEELPNGNQVLVEANYGYGPFYDQYIVHETAGESESAPSLFPVQFTAEFQNPAQDRVTFIEHYTDPHPATFFADNEDVVGRWVQGMDASWIAVQESGSEGIFMQSYNSLVYNSAPSSSQVGNFDTSELMDSGAVGYAVDQVDHPADFVETFQNYYRYPTDGNFSSLSAISALEIGNGYELNGLFLPIDNEGNLFTTAGFQIRGIRDLVQPNQLVNGGKYNLEVILSFGNRYYDGEVSYFDELFRIDALITPEIFTNYGSSTQSSLFPDRLLPDDNND